MGKVIVLASGGVDSAVLLQRAHAAGELGGVMWAHYGQQAGLREQLALEAIRKHLGIVDIPYQEIPLTTVHAAPMNRPMYGDDSPRVVPFRNLILIGHALNWAATIGASRVWYGATLEDHADYVDCRPSWVYRFNSLLQAPHEGELADQGVVVEAPLVHTSKTEIIAEARALGLLELAWSCYDRGPKPCKTCASCTLRAASQQPVTAA